MGNNALRRNNLIFLTQSKGSRIAPAQYPFPRTAEPQVTVGSLVKNPRDQMVTIIAMTQGEEGFFDANKNGVLDPQGRAIGHALSGLGYPGIGEVRVGKRIEIELAETDPAAALAQAEEMARKLLANLVIESFKVELA